jgi:hypothetical protein
MSLEAELYSALTSSTLITAYTSNRVYPVELPQKPTYPAVTYFRVASNPQVSLEKYEGLNNPLFQMDIWSTSYLQTKEIKENMVTVMDNTSRFQSRYSNDVDFFESEANTKKKLYRLAVDFSVWGQE